VNRPGADNIPLSRPDITDAERAAVAEVVAGGVLSIGPKLLEFEEAFRDFVGSKHAIAVSSGTAALHLALRACGVSSGDEVITTPFSFVASANVALFERAKPVFVDIDPATLNMDASLIEANITPNTHAILPVHVFGEPCAMNDILETAGRYDLAVIEDACEAVGATCGGKKVGTFGDAGTFAFYPNKQMTTGEGGMIVTNDDRIAAYCRSARNQGRNEDMQWLVHERLGYNYRLDEMSAALGLVQVRRIEELLRKRRRVARAYAERLATVTGVETLRSAPGNVRSWFVYVVLLPEGTDRDAVMYRLRAEGVGCRDYFTPIHLQPFYRKMFGYREGDFPVAEAVAARTLALPFHNNLSEDQIDTVVEALAEAIRRR